MKSAPIGAWKCTFPPFNEMITHRPTDQPTDQLSSDMRLIGKLLLNHICMYYVGKKYCYGGIEGEYCHCDYCKCKHGFGQSGYGGCKGHKQSTRVHSCWVQLAASTCSKLISELFLFITLFKYVQVHFYSKQMQSYKLFLILGLKIYLPIDPLIHELIFYLIHLFIN